MLDTVMECETFRGNLFFTLTNFGDHCLHHLFPTVDHALLPDLAKIVLSTCKEFEMEFRSKPWWKMFIGQFEQLLRTEGNPVPVALRVK